jgi:hypothetical protein|tara:strand:- start:302 stop:901 length:600 start_codon:yes stop_codon:yes gene_type:complete
MTYKPPDCKNVYIKKGRVTSHKRWDRPKQHLFNQWLTHIKRYIEKNNITIDVYVCGKFLENPELTWDIDVILTHKDISNFDIIKLLKIADLMNYGMQLGFDKFNILIDMACYLPLNEQGKFWYSVEDFQKNGKIRSNVLYTFDKIYQNGEIIQDFNTQPNTSVIQLGDNLFLVNKLSPSEKHISRIKDGIEYKKPQKIL